MANVIHLPQENFYQQRKRDVWVIEISVVDSKDEIKQKYGSGFAFSNKVILTCAHLFAGINYTKIMGRRLDEDEFKHEMKVKFEQPKWDITSLEFKTESTQHDHGNISISGKLDAGEEIYCIGHTEEFVGSFMIGKTGFACVEEVSSSTFTTKSSCSQYQSNAKRVTPTHRVMGHVWNMGTLNMKPKMMEFEKKLNPLIQLIQCIGFVFEESFSGAPVYNNYGDIVGMLAMKANGHAVAVHSSALNAFKAKFDENEKKPEEKWKPREKKRKGSTSHQC